MATAPKSRKKIVEPTLKTITVSSTKYCPEMDKQVKLLGMLGATRATMADFFGIRPDTLDSWFRDRVGFRDAYTEGTLMADARVAHALYQRAIGYEHEDEKVFCNKDGMVTRVPILARYAPDTTAALAWLKARQADQWNTPNKQELTGADGGPIEHDYLQIQIPDNRRQLESD